MITTELTVIVHCDMAACDEFLIVPPTQLVTTWLRLHDWLTEAIPTSVILRVMAAGLKAESHWHFCPTHRVNDLTHQSLFSEGAIT